MTVGLAGARSDALDTSQGAIIRDPAGAAQQHYDLIVVGGGVYSIMTALEATRHGLRPLLLEQADFAGATSHSSLRIVHGGLRYLQSLNIRRSLESIDERAWWLRHFPELVRPLPCLMPLYGDSARRPVVMHLGLRLNDLLCDWRGREAALPRGRVIDAASVQRLWPEVDPAGLLAGALWHDAAIVDPPRLLIEALRWACAKGAIALNYVEALTLHEAAGRVDGVEGCDLETGKIHLFQAPVVINAAGPWSRSFAAKPGNPGLRSPRRSSFHWTRCRTGRPGAPAAACAKFPKICLRT